MLVIFPCVSMKGERSLRAIDHAKNLFSIVYERVTQRAVTRFGMTFLGNSFSTMEISGPSPLGQANLDTLCTHRDRASVLGTRDLRERQKRIIGMDNDVEAIHPRSAKAIKQHSTRYKSRIVDFATRISLGQLENLTLYAELSIINDQAA